MAIANTDGSIVLSTKVDTKGLETGMKGIQSKARAMISTFSKLGGILASVFSVTAIVNFSKEASNLAIEQEASVQRLIDIYGVASEEVGDFIDLNARALGMSKASAVGFSAVYGNLFSVWADQATSAELTNQYLNMTAVIASKTGRTVADVQERIRSGLLGNTEAIEDLGVFVNVKTIEMTNAFQRLADGRSWEQLTAYEQSQVRTLAILEQSTAKYGNQVANTNALVRAQYLASYQDLQATWGQFINTILVPVLKVATKVFDVLTVGMRILAGITGKTVSATQIQTSNIGEASKAIGGAQKNQDGLATSVKNTNKELKKTLAGFDELNTISQDVGDTANGGAGAGAGGASVGGAGGIGDLSLGELGNQGIINEVDETVAKVMGIVGAGLVAIGVILLCFGQIAWGIGFIIAGATLFVASVAVLKSNEAYKNTYNELMKIIGVASALLWIVGVILVCCGVITPLTIGMIVFGAVGIVSVVALNWDEVKSKVKTIFKEVRDWLKFAGMLVLGVILCTTGVGIPIGIALIAKGAEGLISKATIYWNLYGDKIKSVFNAILSWVKTWGLLVLGIILVVSGLYFPLGLALVFAGAKNLTTAKDPKWMVILDKIKAVWKAIKDYYNVNIKKYLTSEYWAQKGKNMVGGLVRKIVDGLNKLFEKLNGFGFNLPDVLGGNRIGFNIPKIKIPQLAKGAVLPPNKPFLAMVGDQQSGTNIEAPLDTIVDAMKIALGGSKGFSGRIEVPLYLNGKQIALAIRDAENELGTQTDFGGLANAY